MLLRDRVVWVWIAGLALAWAGVSLGAAPAGAGVRRAAKVEHDLEVQFKKEVRPLLDRYCDRCHGEKKKGDLDLRVYQTAASAGKDREVWEKVLRNVRSREMPPSDKPPLEAGERERLIAWIEAEVFRTDCDNPDPGRVTLRRLNRTEYNNTIRDLVGVAFRPAEDFPEDDSGYGFDNIGDVLSLPPVLLEKYLFAAEKVLDEAIASRASATSRVKRFPGHTLEGSAPGEPLAGGGRVLAREGDIFVQRKFPVAGEYVLRVRAYGQQAGPEPAKMSVLLDGKELQRVEVKAEEGRPEVFETKLHIAAGPHKFSAAYLNNYVNPAATDPKQRDRNLVVEYLEIESPAEAVEQELPEFHRKTFAARGAKADTNAWARRIIREFAGRAYRRPLASAELDRMMGLYALAERQEEPFEERIRVVFKAVLVSPYFLFRGELQPDPNNPASVHRIDEFALASRLSYFLWSTMPDEELFALARRGRLRRNLDAQLERMLRSPKAEEFARNFAGQWLQLRNLRLAGPDAWLFPEFDDALKVAMERETQLFFEGVMREDRSVLDFLEADYTFVNERLAAHYGIAGVRGEAFQRVSLRGTPRGGVLTHASVLTVTSNPTRTSPVKRGKWILENILGTPPPPPPPGTPDLPSTKEAVLSGSLRQRMEQHRQDPNCANCHARMDPIGFGFENFNAIGGYREKDGAFKVEPEGKLVSGEEFASAAELRKILVEKKREEFLRCLSDKVLTYALGRGLEYYDKCAVDRIVAGLDRGGHRFSSLISEVVKSVPFQMRRGEGTRADSAAR